MTVKCQNCPLAPVYILSLFEAAVTSLQRMTHRMPPTCVHSVKSDMGLRLSLASLPYMIMVVSDDFSI